MKRSTLVAASILLVLAVYVYRLERDDRSDKAETVFDVDVDEIVRLDIVDIGTEEPVSLHKRDGDWSIVTPIVAATDSSEVDMLLENIATMRIERSIAAEEGQDLAEFGLDVPRLEVRFEVTDGSEHGLRFGKDTLTPANQYAQRLDATNILVVASYLSNNLSKTVWELRDKAIFHIGEGAEAARISMTRRGETLELVNEEGLWYVATPPRARADRYEATGLVSRFRRAEMVDLIAEGEATDLTSYGLDPPELALHVELHNDEGESLEPMVLEVGRAESVDYYARTPSRPIVFLVEGGLVEELEKTAEELWSKKLFEASVHRITRFQHGGRLLERETTDDGDIWLHEEAELDNELVEELLVELTNTDVDEIVERAPAFEASTAISIWTDRAFEEISVGPHQGDVVYVRRKGDDVFLELSPETWTAIESLLSAAVP